MSERVLIVSPVRNEAAHIERVARSVAAQTRPPDAWVVVDDGSNDGTLELLRALEAGIPYMTVLEAPAADTGPDRLAVAAEARAFNWALRGLDLLSFTHVGKLDGDIELPLDYFERLLAELADDRRLGVAGGTLIEPRGERWRPIRIPRHHVHGALKLYTLPCFTAIGGIQERLGWDTIDETYARMRGFETRSFLELVARHHRPRASAGGRLRGHARHGECAWVVRYGAGWVTLRAFKVALERPLGVSGLAFLWGYFGAALRRSPKVEDADFRRFTRRELRRRMRRPLRALLPRPAP
jgi:biofilm PGA synthesis N-glycosyltransferase PgaC